jgi:hypothetical protein
MKPYTTTYSSTGNAPSTTTYSVGCSDNTVSLDICGLTKDEAQYAIRYAAMEKQAAIAVD